MLIASGLVSVTGGRSLPSPSRTRWPSSPRPSCLSQRGAFVTAAACSAAYGAHWRCSTCWSWAHVRAAIGWCASASLLASNVLALLPHRRAGGLPQPRSCWPRRAALRSAGGPAAAGHAARADPGQHALGAPHVRGGRAHHLHQPRRPEPSWAGARGVPPGMMLELLPGAAGLERVPAPPGAEGGDARRACASWGSRWRRWRARAGPRAHRLPGPDGAAARRGGAAAGGPAGGAGDAGGAAGARDPQPAGGHARLGADAGAGRRRGPGVGQAADEHPAARVGPAVRAGGGLPALRPSAASRSCSRWSWSAGGGDGGDAAGGPARPGRGAGDGAAAGAAAVDPDQLRQVLHQPDAQRLPGGGRGGKGARDAGRRGEHGAAARLGLGGQHPRGDLARIFEPFFTTREGRHGTGAVDGVLHRAGPRRQISVHLVARSGHRVRGGAAAGRRPRGGAGVHVLVVDDELSMREYLEMLLVAGGLPGERAPGNGDGGLGTCWARAGWTSSSRT